MDEMLVAGLVAVAIGLVEIIKGIVKKFGADKSSLIEEERIWLRELHEWHNKEDADGVKVWYIRQSLADAFASFAVSVDAQTRALEAISNKLTSLEDKIGELKDDQESRISWRLNPARLLSASDFILSESTTPNSLLRDL